MPIPPDTKFTQSGDVSIAYQVLDSYQFSFAQNAQNIFWLLCKPMAIGCSQRNKFESTFWNLYGSGLSGLGIVKWTGFFV